MKASPKSNKRTFFTLLLLTLLFFSIVQASAQDDSGGDDDYGETDYGDDDYGDDYGDDDYGDDDYGDDDYGDDDYGDDDYGDDDYGDDYGGEYGDYGDYEDYGDFEDDFSEMDSAGSETADATYAISGTDLLGSPTEQHQQLWDAFVRIIPADRLQQISRFEVFNDPETSGYVYQDENDPTKFVLGLNVAELENPSELAHTIIHEYAHILTLNPAQVDGTLALGSSGTCSTLQLDEGCTGATSYINQFNSQFWANPTATTGQFVSDYASSNVAEDISESFTAFVLRARPTGDTIVDQKINFFYNFPELVQLRNQIRANMANTTGG